MTNTESNDLINDPTFRGRVKVSCLKYASSISIEPSDTVAHNTRLRWSTQTMQSPDQVAMQITPNVVIDPAVQLAGSAIDDVALQAAVEVTVNKMF
jgi:hypothetical protein